MLHVEQLIKRYTTAANSAGIQGLDFHVRQGEFFTLLGPSGCGKTTTLRSVAGLEIPDSGEIRIDGQVVYSSNKNVVVPVAKRPIAMVFQSYAIWPHMTVYENVAFPLRSQRVAGSEIKRRVQHALELVGLGALGDRLAPLLSGGQQQRVALARAIVKEAPLLLLDEPLSNLDAKLREQMRHELRDLQRRIGTTAIYVTHDQEEALSLSDRIAVMQAGSIIELDTPSQLYYRPQTRFAAQFLGQTELLPCSISARFADHLVLDTPFGVLHSSTFPRTMTASIALMARPEHFELVDHAGDRPNVIGGTVEKVLFSGKFVEYQVRAGDAIVRAHCSSLRLAEVGSHILLHIPPDRCVVVNEGN
jgi:iron(III) transport system ATP-binding protein